MGVVVHKPAASEDQAGPVQVSVYCSYAIKSFMPDGADGRRQFGYSELDSIDFSGIVGSRLT